MRAKRISVFGLSGYHQFYKPGDVSPVSKFLNNDNYADGIIFYVKGTVGYRAVGNPNIIGYRTAGILSTNKETELVHKPNEVLEYHFSEDSEFICIPYQNNQKDFPKFESVVMEPGEKKTFTKGSKIFLARGKLTASGREFNSDKELSLQSGDIEFEAHEQSYLLLVI